MFIKKVQQDNDVRIVPQKFHKEFLAFVLEINEVSEFSIFSSHSVASAAEYDAWKTGSFQKPCKMFTARIKCTLCRKLKIRGMERSSMPEAEDTHPCHQNQTKSFSQTKRF